MNNDQDRIESLKKKLYSISEEPPHTKRSRLHAHGDQVSRDFGTSDSELDSVNVPQASVMSPQVRTIGKRKGNVLKNVLIVSVIAFIAAALFAWYVFTTGGNYISASNIDIRVIGPVSSPAGEELKLDLDIYNGNSTPLEAVDVIVEYPEGTRRVDDRATTVLSERLPVGDIERGATARRTISVLLFGEENVKKDIKVTVEYKVPGSIILFHTEKIYPIYIGTAPITIDVSSFKEVVPNQQTTFKAVITSNSQNVIRNIALKASYPSGFQFTSGSPKPSFGNDVWTLGDLNPGDKREIEITGQIVGDAEVERYFGFIAGTEDPTDKAKIGITLVESKEKVAIKKPFLAADISLNKVGTLTYVAEAGQPIRGEIVWQNNLKVPIFDLNLELKLDGQSIDKRSVAGSGGYYRSIDNTIIWDKSTQPQFAQIQPGVSGITQFDLMTVAPTTDNNAKYRRQLVTLDLQIKAKRLSEDQVPEEIKSSASRNIKVASGLRLNSRLVRNVGPFENTGAIPPVAERPTTYTVLNSVTNSFNNVTGVTYTFTLPSYVTWLGKVYPEAAIKDVKYNADSRQVTWTLGDISPGTGFNSSAKEFSYQVSFLPGYGQIGSSPVIISNQRVAGRDTFTETIVEGLASQLDTKIETDPSFMFGWEKVVE